MGPAGDTVHGHPWIRKLWKYIHSGVYGEHVLRFCLWRPFGAGNGLVVQSWKFAAEWWICIWERYVFGRFWTLHVNAKSLCETKFMDVNIWYV